MIGISRGWFACAVIGLLAACSTPPSRPLAESHQVEATYHVLADEHMAHYPLAMGSTSSGAEPLDHPTPAYPSAMLDSCPAEVRVRVLMIVGTDGRVDEARIDDAATIAAPFIAAVRATTLGWRFEPLVINNWAADAHDEPHQVDTQIKPFSLPYEFRFACHAGKALVSSTPTAQQ